MKREPRFRALIGSPLAPAARVALGVLGVALLIAGYEYYVHYNLQHGGSPKLSPGFGQLAAALGEMTEADRRTGRAPFWSDTWASLAVLAKGLGLGVVVAVAVGIAMGVLSTVHALLSPVMTALAKIPAMALLALFFVLFGVTGDALKIALIVFGIGPSTIIGIMQVARAVPKNSIVKAYSLGASTPQVIVRAILPQIVPQVIEMIRLALGPAWIYLIAAEYIASSEGIGHGIELAKKQTRIDVILVYVAWLAILGTAIDLGCHGLSRLVAPWATTRRDD
jgi:NitT/TauT family transport system permease protein